MFKRSACKGKKHLIPGRVSLHIIVKTRYHLLFADSIIEGITFTNLHKAYFTWYENEPMVDIFHSKRLT